MNSYAALLWVLLILTGCAGSPEPLVVKQFNLRDQRTDLDEDPMIRSEKLRRLHGAVSMQERASRLGQYYNLQWNDEAHVGQGEVELQFDFQQGATGSRIRRMTQRFPASQSSGTADFAIIGEDYFLNGRVLAWKATLLRAGKPLASKQSYLWQ